MGIIRLEDKYKSKYKVQLTPERHYISSSSGITGSVYVFPNRSHTQKDNIDERLNLAPMALEGSEFSGAVVKPYDSNSLEARRLEIYQGNFSKFIGGAFTDALIYEYTVAIPGDPHNLNGKYTGEFINDEIDNDSNWDWWDDNISNWSQTNTTGLNTAQDQGPTATRFNDRRIFVYQSNDKWVDDTGIIYNRLPENDRDRRGQNFEIALGMLLDGANPFTEDHAWRQDVIQQVSDGAVGYNIGNSSFTGTPPTDLVGLSRYQFTGFKIFEDELGIPYLDSPLTSKEDVNAWPPEVAKWNANVISNWVVKGYSDLSMHPRNATKKEVALRKANHDLFSSGSLYQRSLANRIEDIGEHDIGWWVHNDHALCLSKYTDSSGTVKEPALGYWNNNNQYTYDWSSDEATFEFWIKPCKEQTDVGTVFSLRDDYAVCLIPDQDYVKDGVPQRFKIGVYSQSLVNDGTTPSVSDTTLSQAGGGRYISVPVLLLDQWHHVIIRYGSLFNNGLLSVYVDSVSITDGNIDGLFNGSNRTDGFFDINYSSTPGDVLIVGGWPSVVEENRALGSYASDQEVRPISGSSTVFNYSSTLGKSVVPQKTLKSELKELRLWSETRSEHEILANKYVSLNSTANLKAYIPFFFDPRTDTPQWKRLAYIPFEQNPQTTEEFYQKGRVTTLGSDQVNYNPVQYCTNSAHIVGMPFVNVHSHLREYVNGSYPVIFQHDRYHSTSSTVYPTINDKNYSNSRLSYFINNWQSFPWLRAINSMIIPSDNELFISKYELMGDNAHVFQSKDYLRLEGNGVGSTDSIYELANFYDDEIFAIQNTIIKIDPTKKSFKGKTEQYGTKTLASEGKLTDKDFLSPLSTTISVPHIYYGNRIQHESIELSFTLNEEGKTIRIVDYQGALYRMDKRREFINAKVGHVDYANGIICIFSPLLTSLGVDDFDLKFKGEKNMHVMQLDIPCAAGVANKSKHPTYKKLKASSNANETDSNLTYISTIYLHDENLNIIGKVNLAQPVQKREEDSFIFRVKVDF